VTDGHEAESPDPSALIQPPLRFSGIVASAGRIYRARLKQIVSVFGVIGALIFLVPALTFFDVGDNLAIPIILLAGVVLPSALLSLGFAVAAAILSRRVSGRDASVRPSIRDLKPRVKDLVVSALVSGMLALTVVVFFGPFGSLVLALFYGPPILIQVIAVEDLGIQPAWARTRELMQGHWARILLALLSVALGLGILATTLLSLGGALAADAPRLFQLALFIVLELVIFGLGYSFLGAAGYVCYYDVKARYEASSSAAE
jgi:hypothetical protein